MNTLFETERKRLTIDAAARQSAAFSVPEHRKAGLVIPDTALVVSVEVYDTDTDGTPGDDSFDVGATDGWMGVGSEGALYAWASGMAYVDVTNWFFGSPSRKFRLALSEVAPGGGLDFKLVFYK